MREKTGVYPLIPYIIPKPWGGGHLDHLVENRDPQRIGEYVIFSDLLQFPVRVRLGSEIMLLVDFWRHQEFRSAELPFMIKILSTAEPISLQNHPSDADVKALGLTGQGKFECWSILDADQYARAYLGLRPGTDKSVLRSLATDTKPLSHFNEYEPRQGDLVKLEPGLVHCTTGRILFYEIQQKSDYTFRLYDFGRGRRLHTEQAMQCVRAQQPDISHFSAGLQTDKFSVKYHRVQPELSFRRMGGEFSVVTWFGGEATLSAEAEEFVLNWGDSLLLTTEAQCRLRLSAKAGDNDRYHSLPMIDMLFEAYV